MNKIFLFLGIVALLAGAAPLAQPERAWVVAAGQTVASMTMVDSQIVVVGKNGTVDVYSSAGVLQEALSFNFPLLAAPFFDGNVVIAVTKDGIAQAVVRRAGTVLWKTDLSADQASRPILYEGSLWYGIGKGKNGALVKVNRESGAVLLVANFTSPVVTEPVLLNGNMVVAASNGTMKIIDVRTGLALYQDEVAGLYRGQKPLFMGDKLLLSPTGDYRKVEAVSAASLGKRAWTVSFERSWYGDAVELNIASVQPPLERKAALARALAPSLPAGLAKTLDPVNEFVATGSVHTSGWVGSGKNAVIICEEMGAAGLSLAHILAVNADSGTTIVDYQETVSSSAGMGCINPIVDDDRIIGVMGRNKVVAVSTITQSSLWSTTEVGAIVSLAKGSQGAVYVATSLDSIIAYRMPSMIRPPLALGLLPNAPNPFVRSTQLKYALPSQSQVNLAILDAQGRTVVRLLSEVKGPGMHTLFWNGSDAQGRLLPSGVYVARLTAGKSSKQIKMTISR